MHNMRFVISMSLSDRLMGSTGGALEASFATSRTAMLTNILRREYPHSSINITTVILNPHSLPDYLPGDIDKGCGRAGVLQRLPNHPNRRINRA
ncbi:hypothetical protein CBM2634_B60052 [Cupriavidus taiwanensis]|uniref:Uncharacterized protein n=1 Tax=Cupriavidus taiwanensis TaxID=164546 RepID=A0A375JDI6_9BURK|nr:hypothetical protein CBM2634_B60052 [Cupriavidus taiwanensis]